MVSKELGNVHFNAIMSWTWAVGQGEVTFGSYAFGVGQRQCTRMGLMVHATVVGGLMHCESLM